jgi:DNA-directed RNA polymerase II subunit RPB1
MSNIYTQYHPSKIIGIQFSILSPEQIRDSSVVEVVSRDTYDNNKPKIGGLFDPRMGILDSGFICPTDGNNYMDTPGYFGHMELAKPVFYIQYLPTIIKIIKCICFKCSKLKISKENYKEVVSMLPEERWSFVYAKASNVTRCGQETLDGCGCKQPYKIRKEGLATLYADFKDVQNKDEVSNSSVKLSPEVILKIFKRISDDDIEFMGFSKIWSRPEWMICQVLAVPPPSMRPSIKHDAQQRSEDDVTHILCNIVKTNKTLKDKLSSQKQNNKEISDVVINDWQTVLQYYIATLVDNKLPGVGQVCQRSGRPLKSIKDRLNGKQGRVRGNLQGKRVDFSARSVITADPNLSIRELGIPLKIAKNITKPVTVNDNNKEFLRKLIMNGPDKWPGAKILEKKNRQITLRYADKSIINLENGDIVHRHIMDGDPVLFNRQPTLHRMSMMCHIAKVMKIGDTFRMNVADTKPYNADFDGDEMNLHMPQDSESESELLNLAAVPHQIINPANNSCIVGIFQDSLLGAHQFTRNDVKLSKRDAMNLLMNFNNVDIEKLDKEQLTSFDILSQILPEFSLYKKNNDDVIIINNGTYEGGRLDKGALGSGSNGILHRIYNDHGSMACSDFIDNFQNIITEYMKTSSYSVGISDLISNENTKESIRNIINNKKIDVKKLIENIQFGVFDNNTGKTNNEEFEQIVNRILNQTTDETAKEAKKNLGKDNHFVTMATAGSKGSAINLSQMISCVGQQNVQGKRIPYGFDYRTLPHFTKFDDTPRARGFVENSYINGLEPEELFFHAMGGRTGLIDTAVKTSQTGYIQRKLIKGMEDIKIEYDMTVRNNKGKIVQFSYGDDSIDTTKIECLQNPLVFMSDEDIYKHFNISAIDDKESKYNFNDKTQTKMKNENKEFISRIMKYIKFMIEIRDTIVDFVNKRTNNENVYLPVNFNKIINNIQNKLKLHKKDKKSCIDISPLECLHMVEVNFKNLESYYVKPNSLFRMMYFFHLSPDHLFKKGFNKLGLQYLLETISYRYKSSIVAPGEMVGMIAAQSIGEPTTQMTLNTFHFAGVSSKSNVTRGVPRIDELLSLSANCKNPSLTIFMKEKDQINEEKVNHYIPMIENTCLYDLVDAIEICYEPDVLQCKKSEDQLLVTQFNEFEKILQKCNDDYELGENNYFRWIIRLKLDDNIMLEKNISMNDIHYTIKTMYGKDLSCCFSDYNDSNLIFRIHVRRMKDKVKNDKTKKKSLDESDDIHYIKVFQDELLKNVILRGVKKIKKVLLRNLPGIVTKETGQYKNISHDKGDSKINGIWVLDTVGSNLSDILALDYIDNTKTITNDVIEMYNTLGIEAARQVLYNEFTDVMEFDGAYINSHHLDILCDRMCYNHSMVSIFRHGINNDNIGVIAKASFEETPEMFFRAARHGELDNMCGVSANVMCGQEGYFGTGCFQTILDIDEFKKLEYDERPDELKTSINKSSESVCNSLTLENNVSNIKTQVWMDDDDSYELKI